MMGRDRRGSWLSALTVLAVAVVLLSIVASLGFLAWEKRCGAPKYEPLEVPVFYAATLQDLEAKDLEEIAGDIEFVSGNWPGEKDSVYLGMLRGAATRLQGLAAVKRRNARRIREGAEKEGG